MPASLVDSALLVCVCVFMCIVTERRVGPSPRRKHSNITDTCTVKFCASANPLLPPPAHIHTYNTHARDSSLASAPLLAAAPSPHHYHLHTHTYRSVATIASARCWVRGLLWMRVEGCPRNVRGFGLRLGSGVRVAGFHS